MPRQSTYWGKFVFVYILQLFSYATSSQLHVRLIAPYYVTHGSTATMHCNHTVPHAFLHEVKFMKDDKKILQYIKDRKPPFLEGAVEGANMQYLENGTTIKLKNVRFEASGSYSCQVSMTTPIYSETSESVQMKVIVPQTENPKITFKKSMYVVGESLEANCTSSAAHPVPHLTWYINDKEVDISLVNHYPHTYHKDQLMSATAKLTIEVSALHAGENGYLEISCSSTIPDYPLHHVKYADIRKETVSGIKIDKNDYVAQNIQNLISITDNDEVTSMSWGDDERREILIACGVKKIRSVKVYDTNCSTFTCSFFCNIGTGKISGISRYDEAILTAVQSGEVKLWRFKEEDGFIIKAGENLDKMRHSKTNKHLIATGGQEHMLKLFDIERQIQIFSEKNLPHDWLQLKVPIWISDIEFFPNTEQIVTVSKYGHIRLYDPKAQRRPVINIQIKNEALTTLGVLPREKQIIVGSGKGKMNLVDLRNPAKVLNTYKGFVGSITGIACCKNEPYVVSVSLDRFLRIHHIDTKQLLKKIYLTSKISCMLLRSDFSLLEGNKINGENTQTHNNKITENSEAEKQENIQNNSDNDSEYDMLFEEMPVVTNKEDKKVTRKKRGIKKRSVLDNKIVPQKSVLRKNGKPERSYKKIKK